MDSKAIIAIAVVAILVVAGACVYVFVLDKDKEKSSDYHETLEEIEVGDEIEMGIELKVVTHIVDAGSDADFFDQMYYDGGGDLIDDETVTFDGKEYECRIYQKIDEEDDVMMNYYVVQGSGVVLLAKPVNADGYVKLIASDFDVSKSADDHLDELKPGNSYQYDIEMVKTFDKYTGKYKGSSITTIDENLDGVIKFTNHTDLDGKQDTDKKLASIEGDVYKFEGDDMEYTKAGAMQFYSFSQAMEFLTEMYGDAIVPGEKKVITMDTVYGEREVTRQMFTIEVPLVGEIHYTFFYGDADVLYKYIVGTHTDMDEDDYMAMTVTYTLKDCTAVTTEEI